MSLAAVLTRRGASLTPGWTPARLSGVVAWWRADDLAGADGSAVSSWTDRIAGQTVTQLTGSQQPLLKSGANGINNRPVVRFAGSSSQYLSSARGVIPAQAPIYCFAIGKPTNSAGTMRIASISNPSSPNVGIGLGTGANMVQITTYNVADLTSGYSMFGSAGLGYWGHSGSAYYLNRDNLYTLETAAAANATAGANTFTIGGRSTSNSDYYTGDLAELVFMTSQPTTTDRYLMAKYANERYGITVGTPYNSSSPTTTPSADATGTCIETSVLYFPSGWNGHNYWCAFVPYGSNDVSNENPTILYSDDGNTWSSPAGAPVPIVPYPGGGAAGNNSDPSLYYHAADGKLYLFYSRENCSPTSLNGVWFTSSADGATWSAVSQVTSTVSSADNEAKVVYNSATSEWWMFTIDGSPAGGFYRRISSTGPTTGYGARAACSLTLPGGRKIWHNGNVARINGKWVTAFSDDASARQMWLASSTDGTNWTVGIRPIVIGGGRNGTSNQWDNGASIYRLTLADSGDGSNMWGWYSTYGGVTTTRMSQKVTIPFAEIP